MAFSEITDLAPTIPVSANHFPRFVFPDVTGSYLGLLELGRELHRAGQNKGRIYLWDDSEVSLLNLDEYAESIANEICSIQKSGPLFIAGYSWGCALARVVAQKLHLRQRAVSFFGIDAPAIPASQ